MLQLQAHASEGGFGLPDDDRRVVDVRRTLATLTADFKRLTELQEVRSAAWRTASAALQAVEEWLRDGRPHGTTLEDFEGPKPTLNKGETVIDAKKLSTLMIKCVRPRAARGGSESVPPVF